MSSIPTPASDLYMEPKFHATVAIILIMHHACGFEHYVRSCITKHQFIHPCR